MAARCGPQTCLVYMGDAPLRVTAWAKVNLLLRIVGRRPDGYHDLETVFLPLRKLCDDIELLPTGSGLSLECDQPGVPCDHRNLAWRAAEAICAATCQPAHYHIRLRKRIPTAAGLGGGSSDAAAVLRLLNGRAPVPLSTDRLQAMARQLGADVPFFLQDQACMATGIGDRLMPLPGIVSLPVILVNPGFPLPTPWAYSHVTPSPEPALPPLLRALQSANTSEIAAAAGNGFESVVFHKFPVLAIMIEELLALGCRSAHLCGSGPTIFGIGESVEALEALAGKLEDALEAPVWWWCGLAG